MKEESKIQKIDPQEFKNILQSLGLTEESLAEKIAVQTLVKRWVDIIGPVYANHSEPFAVHGDVLVIITVHSAYKQEILFMRKRILSYSARYLGRDVVKKIEIRIGNLTPKRQKSPSYTADKTGLEGKQNLVSLAEKETDPIAKKRLLELIEFL
ncbi:DUF721 domain-containing protein [Leptospira koniambonensis]|uniref:DUF721 domain-containing protein n=1 Tax=Leptospira koniambonensis TaxID=2484950 RepID=A0A4R9J991_9LEPT|nr:DUF721 domain-containing protein [Leptospira koniambonensis]TGL34381.1 DUF721 domain-containing protein [Leptospira koniambonensis]